MIKAFHLNGTINDIWADELLTTHQQVICETKKWHVCKHTDTHTDNFIRSCIFLGFQNRPRLNGPIDRSASHDTSRLQEKCLPLYSPPPVDGKGPAFQGANAKLGYKTSPLYMKNMKIRFTIVSIKKHWVTVCTVESSLNYRQETHEAKKKNHLRVSGWTSERSVPGTQKHFSHTFIRSVSAFQHSSPA